MIRNILIRNGLKGMCAIMLSVLSFAASAVPIVDTVGNVSNLDVNGTRYNVTWNFGAASPAVNDFSLFIGDAVFAGQFMNAVFGAFLDNNYTGAQGQRYYGVDFLEYDPLTSHGLFIVDDDVSSLNINPLYRSSAPHQNFSFEPTAGYGIAIIATVPEPSIVLLITSGLIAFGVARRKARA